jgi:hypothetical protein
VGVGADLAYDDPHAGKHASPAPTSNPTRPHRGPAGGSSVDVRIGVIHTVKEIDVELPADVDRDKVKKQIDSALADDSKILWLTDHKGRDIAVPSSKIAYIELGGPESSRRVGFGAS